MNDSEIQKTLVIGCGGQLGTDCTSVIPGARGIDFPELDITNRSLCFETLDEINPSVIVNCAAYTAVDACESDSACWKVNADGPGYLAEWAAKYQRFVIHISTDYVFSGERPLFEASIETDGPGPVSEYGRSKLAGEQAILKSGAQVAILRTAWLYGAHGKNFLKTMLRLALQNPERELRVVNDQYGSPTWSHTLARQVSAVMAARATGIFHATSEGYCSWFDLASRFLQLMDLPHRIAPCTTEEYPTPAKRPTNSILENAHAKALGVNVFKDWDEELACFVNQNREALLDEMREVMGC